MLGKIEGRRSGQKRMRWLDGITDSMDMHPKGDQSWVFIGRTDVEAETPILWPPDVKS